jgi:ATP-binding cassette subfamily C (CFTR/MRP) protein 1
VIESFVENYKAYELEKLGVTYRNTLMAAIYRKCLRLDNKALAAQSTGKIVTLMSNDAQKIQEVMVTIHAVWSSPLIIVVILGLLYREVQWACFVGLAVMMLLVPMTAFIGKRLGLYRREIVSWTDKRTSIMSEVINGMRVIKFYDLEEPFKKMAGTFRNEEAKRMLRIAWLQGGFGLVLFVGPVLVAVSCFATYTAAGNKLTPAKVFTALPLFSLLRMPMGFLPSILLSIINCKVALKRISGFLAGGEVTDEDPGFITSGVKGSVIIKDGFFKWDEDDNRPVTLRNINLHCKPGTLTMIVGAVGCGKSSVLGTLFKQIPRQSGSVEVGGSLAYVPQTPWIMNATIRENVLMGAEFAEDRYRAALTAAQLGTDLEQFTCGDMTEIGERGVTLSGGQKQRVAIARAVYADADVYVLDDPLSAVDAHVGAALFEECLRGPLHGKTVLLVTNALQHVHRADQLVWLVNGEIKRQGSYEEVSSDPDFVELVGAHVIAEDDDDEGAGGEKILARKAPAGKVMELSTATGSERGVTGNEDRSVGTVGWRVVGAYVGAAGGLWWLLLLLTGYTVEQGAKTFTDYWLILWTKDQFGLPLGQYIGLYAAIAAGYGAITYMRSVSFAFGAVRAAVNLHAQLLTKVMRLPMAFFDTNPSGRVINRFSRDTEILDAVLPLTLIQLGACASNLFGIICFICYAVPWFTIAIPPLALAYVLIQRYYIPGARELQRLEAVARSPVYTGFSEAVNGLTTIRAYAREVYFTRLEDNLIWSNGLVYLMQRAASGWFSIRLDFLGLTVCFAPKCLVDSIMVEQTLCRLSPSRHRVSWVVVWIFYEPPSTSAFVVPSSALLPGVVLAEACHVFIQVLTSAAMLAVRLDVEPGKTGLALTYALELTKFLKFGARLASKAESDFNSVERMVQYLDVASEADRNLPEDPHPSKWPTAGKIEVIKAMMRYRPGLPLVLKGVSFAVEPGEHIGIVGRTGSGKSSLLLAFFRMVELESGDIVVDGHSLSSLGVSVVRQAFSMIPQDPFMFSGSVRRNLDPLDRYSDADVWKAIERVELKPVISGMDKKLDSVVADGGSNFSQGQRQLFCLARALLKRTRILMMDEATASVDLDTDVLIQKVVRTEFAETTVLTIAHRLNTIMDSDKVLVMDGGHAVEYDVPYALLKNPDGHFTNLVNNTGANAARKLRDIAKHGSYSKLRNALIDNDLAGGKTGVDSTGQEAAVATGNHVDATGTAAAAAALESKLDGLVLDDSALASADGECVPKLGVHNLQRSDGPVQPLSPPATRSGSRVTAGRTPAEEKGTQFPSVAPPSTAPPPMSQLMVSAASVLSEAEPCVSLQPPPSEALAREEGEALLLDRHSGQYTVVDNLMAADAATGELFETAASSPSARLPSRDMGEWAKAQEGGAMLRDVGNEGIGVYVPSSLRAGVLASDMFVTPPGSVAVGEVTVYENAAAAPGVLSPPTSQGQQGLRVEYMPKLDFSSESRGVGENLANAD